MSRIFSVVTVTYNSEKYLDETIQSVILQKGDFFIEYIVIDNCSTDSTVEILEKYQGLIESGSIICNCLGVNFEFISEKDSGMYEALCKGMAVSKGDYFSYINSDDFYLPNAFATVLKVFEDEEVNWLTGVPGLYNDRGAITTLDIPCIYNQKHMLRGVYGKVLPYLQQESTFWRCELCTLLDMPSLAQFKYAGDYYIWNTFSKKYRLYTVDAQLSGFRMHGDNKSLNSKAYNEEFESIVEGSIAIYDYPLLFAFKVLYKIVGNNLLRVLPGVIKLHR